MFPIKSSDAYIKENGIRSTVGKEIGSGGGGSDLPEHSISDAGKVLTVGDDGDLEWDEPGQSINWMTQQAWNALTFEQKKAEGFTAIGTEGDIQGTYYDYTNAELWKYNTDHDNVVDIYYDNGFNFHGFYSDTVGDIVDSRGRGGTRSSNAKAFICNALGSNSYGYFLMFAKTENDLACINTSYYNIAKVAGYDMYVGNNWSGAFYNNTDVTLTHDNVAANLKDIFDSQYYTMNSVAMENNVITFPETYTPILQAILTFI